MNRKIVTVFGSSQPGPGTPLYQTALELGRAIAGAGWTLCNGGYGGTMEATARGAQEAGGHTIGVTCALFKRSGANAYIRQEIPTFDLLGRLNALVRLGRAYVALPGGSGTLLELALVYELLNKSLLRPPRPIVVVGDHWQPALEILAREGPAPECLHLVAQVPEIPQVLAPYLAPRR